MRSIEKRLDRLSSTLCRLLAGGVCKASGKNCDYNGIEAHHIISSSHRRQRWNQYNLVWICRSCHRYEHDVEQTIFRDLDQRVYIWSLPELKELEKELKSKIKEYSY